MTEVKLKMLQTEMEACDIEIQDIKTEIKELQKRDNCKSEIQELNERKNELYKKKEKIRQRIRYYIYPRDKEYKKEYQKKHYVPHEADYTQTRAYKMFGKRLKELTYEERKELDRVRTREARAKKERS